MDIKVKIFCECGKELEHIETKYIAPGGWVEKGYVATTVSKCESCRESQQDDHDYAVWYDEMMGG